MTDIERWHIKRAAVNIVIYLNQMDQADAMAVLAEATKIVSLWSKEPVPPDHPFAGPVWEKAKAAPHLTLVKS